MRLRRVLAAVIATALLLSGCRTLSLSGSDILAPPRAAGNLAAFQKLLEEDSGGSYNLINPLSGEFKSGLMLYDLDNSGTEEAIALYTLSDGSARMLCASSDGSGYRLMGSGKLVSSNVNSLSFADVDSNGVEDIIVSCDAGAPIAGLNAYMVSDDFARVKIGEGFTDYVCGDFDGDKADDILLLMPRSATATARAELMAYSGGSFKKISEAELDPEVYYYSNPKFDRISDDIYGAVLDGVLENESYSTQLLYYDPTAKALINPLFVYSGYARTGRPFTLNSMDINDDGIVEFPLCELMEYTKSEDVSSVCYSVFWSVYDAAELDPRPVISAVYSVPMGVMLALPDTKLSGVTARSADSNEMQLFTLSHKGQEPVVGAVQLTVKRYDKGDFDSSMIPEAVLYESNTDVYTYIKADGSVFTDEEILNGFIPLNK